MGFVRGLMERRANLAQPPDWLLRYFLGFGANSKAGVRVTEFDALYHNPVFACTRILSEDLAKIPLYLYQHIPGGGKSREISHSAYQLLSISPNPLMTAFTLREMMTFHTTLWGNGYCEIEWNGAGQPVGLWPLRPDRMRIQVVTAPPSTQVTAIPPIRLRYWYTVDNRIGEIPLEMEQVLHVRGLSFDGIKGMSVVGMMRESIGLGMATEEFGARWFGNGSTPGGVLQHKGRLTPEAHARLKGSWEEAHRGLGNANRVAILEDGVTWQQVGIPPEDAQFLQTRQFQLEEVARGFRMPLNKLQVGQRVMKGTIEQEAIEYATDTLLPWCVRLEEEYARSLLLPRERQKFFFKHFLDGLKRGDSLSRSQANAVGRQNGWLTTNDIRDSEDMNPIPTEDGGDELLAPMNMVPLASLVEGKSGTTVKNPTPTAGSGPTSGDQGAAGTLTAARQLLVRELRATDGPTYRRRLANGYRRLFVDAGERILRREREKVLGQADRLLGQRDEAQFTDWLRDFYRDHGDYVSRQYLPVLHGLADAIGGAAASEIGAESTTGNLDAFVGRLAEGIASDWTISSRSQLNSLLLDVVSSGGEPLDAVTTRFDEWNEHRAGRFADLLVVRGDNALSKETWRMAGVSGVRWINREPNCAYCAHLSGRSATMGQFFVSHGAAFQPEGADRPLDPSHDVGHGPLHAGCDCSIEPDWGA